MNIYRLTISPGHQVCPETEKPYVETYPLAIHAATHAEEGDQTVFYAADLGIVSRVASVTIRGMEIIPEKKKEVEAP